MKITLTLLAEFPGTKTVCILLSPDAVVPRPTNSTRISRLFVYDPATTSEVMVTVVVKGSELPSRMIGTLVYDFLAQGNDAKHSYTVEIDDLALTAPQASRS
jgi:hypothetical protein